MRLADVKGLLNSVDMGLLADVLEEQGREGDANCWREYVKCCGVVNALIDLIDDRPFTLHRLRVGFGPPDDKEEIVFEAWDGKSRIVFRVYSARLVTEWGSFTRMIYKWKLDEDRDSVVRRAALRVYLGLFGYDRRCPWDEMEEPEFGKPKWFIR